MNRVEEEVKNELQMLAMTNWDRFVAVTGIDLKRLEICKRRRKGNSLRQIAMVMQMPLGTVRHVCDKCE